MEVTKESLEADLQALRTNRQQAVQARDQAAVLILKYDGAIEQAERTLAVVKAEPEVKPEKPAKVVSMRGQSGKAVKPAEV